MVLGKWVHSSDEERACSVASHNHWNYDNSDMKQKKPSILSIGTIKDF